MIEKRKIGWEDVSCPAGQGYRIMTRDGIKVFDLSEREEFEAERREVAEYLSKSKIKG